MHPIQLHLDQWGYHLRSQIFWLFPPNVSMLISSLCRTLAAFLPVQFPRGTITKLGQAILRGGGGAGCILGGPRAVEGPKMSETKVAFEGHFIRP